MEQQTASMVHQHLDHDLEHVRDLHTRLLLVDGPIWIGHEIKQSDDAKAVIIDRTLILCRSKVEYQTLMRLLQDPMKCVPFRDLMTSFNPERDREALGKRIQKIRRKLPADLMIHCEIGQGYVLREKSHQKEQEIQGRDQ
jgi:hypothetical protein